MTTSDNGMGEVECFKYLGFFVQRYGGFMVDVKHRIKCC